MPRDIFTIGHSNHGIARFIGLLRGAGIAVVADVRSTPYSRRLPHFNRPALACAMAEVNIDYHHCGQELGGRPQDPACYRDGRLDYELVAATPWFAAGLKRVEALAQRRRLALMCAEREPLDCHRFLLVARQLCERGARISHILADGTIEPQEAVERRLLAATGLGDLRLMADAPPTRDLVRRAYALRGERLLRGRRAPVTAR